MSLKVIALHPTSQCKVMQNWFPRLQTYKELGSFEEIKKYLVERFGEKRVADVIERLRENAEMRMAKLRLLKFQKWNDGEKKINKIYEKKAREIMSEFTGNERKLFWRAFNVFFLPFFIYGGLCSNEQMLWNGFKGAVLGTIVGVALIRVKRFCTLQTRMRIIKIWDCLKAEAEDKEQQEE